MIKSKKDYKEYILHDTIANVKREKCSWIRMKVNVWYGNDSYRFLEYLYALRRHEYVVNCKHGLIGKILKVLTKLNYHRIGAKINVNINPNTVGYGFRVPHLTGGGIINAKSVGCYCTANAGVVVGNKKKGEMAVIGNNVDLTVGSKIIGDITIGNNVIVAPNSVVVKDVPDNAVVSGIPAKMLKINDENK